MGVDGGQRLPTSLPSCAGHGECIARSVGNPAWCCDKTSRRLDDIKKAAEAIANAG
jgi:hypothetical protein